MEENPEKSSSSNLAGFKSEIIRKILTSNFSNSKVKISDDALVLVTELLKIIVTEMSVRSMKQAKDDDVSMITVSQVETILPQIMLDFP